MLAIVSYLLSTHLALFALVLLRERVQICQFALAKNTQIYWLKALACIADAESSCDPNQTSPGGYGLFQLDDIRFKNCSLSCSNGHQCKPSDRDCQIDTAVNLLYSVCNQHPDITLCDALAAYWGVVQGQNQGFWRCISKAECKILKTVSCKSALQGSCRGCKPSPEVGARFRCAKSSKVPQCSTL